MSAPRIYVHLGHYGSGKTELSIAEALRLRAQGPVTLVDLDIVNPFFRSNEQRALLEGAGVRLLAPTFANTAVDVPALPASIQSVFVDKSSIVIFDVGGDPAGATALGRYHAALARESVHTRCVVNCLRPWTAQPDQIVAMTRELQAHARVRIDSLVNNTNLGGETTAEHVLDGLAIVQTAAQRLALPVEFTLARRALCAQLIAAQIGQLRCFDPVVTPPWLAQQM